MSMADREYIRKLHTQLFKLKKENEKLSAQNNGLGHCIDVLEIFLNKMGIGVRFNPETENITFFKL